jgi:hypothetical protein
MPDRRTLRLHGVALAVASWTALVWLHAIQGPFDRFGQLRGMDFLQFYAAGWFISSGQVADLYNWQAFAEALPRLVPAAGDLLFVSVYPPQLALLFAPIASLPYFGALAAWTGVSVALYAAAVALTLRLVPPLQPYRTEAWSFALGFPPFLQLLAHGQVASLALLPLLGAFAAFRMNRPWLAGAALALLAFKPQFGTFAIAALALWWSPGLAGGLLLGVGAQVALLGSVLGTGPLLEYANVLAQLLAQPGQFEPKVWAMHGLRGALELTLGRGPTATALWAAGGFGALWLGRRAWNRHQSTSLRFGVLLLAGLVINPHLYVYDLTVAAIALACLVSWFLESKTGDRRVVYAAYALVWLPLIGPLATVTRLQPTPFVMLALLWLLGRDDKIVRDRGTASAGFSRPSMS